MPARAQTASLPPPASPARPRACRAHAARAGSCSPPQSRTAPPAAGVPAGHQTVMQTFGRRGPNAATRQTGASRGCRPAPRAHPPPSRTQSRAPRRIAGAWHAGSDRPKPPPHPHAAGAQAAALPRTPAGRALQNADRKDASIYGWWRFPTLVLSARHPLRSCQAPAPCRHPPSTMGEPSLPHDLRGEAWHRRSPRLRAVPGAWCSGRRQRRFSQGLRGGGWCVGWVALRRRFQLRRRHQPQRPRV